MCLGGERHGVIRCWAWDVAPGLEQELLAPA
jgi:hypothetical protein